MVGVALRLRRLGQEEEILVNWCEFEHGNTVLRLNLLYCSKVAWVSQLISCVSLANTCRGNDIECYRHNAGIAVSDPLSRWT